MALWVCEGTEEQACDTLYAVGLYRCPRCHSTTFHEFGSRPEDEEHPMAKITRHAGPSDATATEPVKVVAVVPVTDESLSDAEVVQEAPGVDVGDEVPIPADGTWSEPIEGDGPGEALPPADDGDGEPLDFEPAAGAAAKGGETVPGPSPRPAANARRDEHVAWALSAGHKGAEQMTKAELLELPDAPAEPA